MVSLRPVMHKKYFLFFFIYWESFFYLIWPKRNHWLWLIITEVPELIVLRSSSNATWNRIQLRICLLMAFSFFPLFCFFIVWLLLCSYLAVCCYFWIPLQLFCLAVLLLLLSTLSLLFCISAKKFSIQSSSISNLKHKN